MDLFHKYSNYIPSNITLIFCLTLLVQQLNNGTEVNKESALKVETI